MLPCLQPTEGLRSVTVLVCKGRPKNWLQTWRIATINSHHYQSRVGPLSLYLPCIRPALYWLKGSIATVMTGIDTQNIPA